MSPAPAIVTLRNGFVVVVVEGGGWVAGRDSSAAGTTEPSGVVPREGGLAVDDWHAAARSRTTAAASGTSVVRGFLRTGEWEDPPDRGGLGTARGMADQRRTSSASRQTTVAL